MRQTSAVILLFIVFQSCGIFQPLTEKNKCITDYFGARFEAYSKYSHHTEFSSEIIYLVKDSSYFFESQGEGRSSWFSYGQYEIKDSTLTLKHNEEQTRKYIMDYKSGQRNASEYTPFITLDYLKKSMKGEEFKKEHLAFFIFDNYKWKIKTDNKLERKINGSDYSADFDLEKLNGYVMVEDSLLAPVVHIINEKKYKIK